MAEDNPDSRKRTRIDKREDEALQAVRTDVGVSGPLNWPTFGTAQPARTLRSRAPDAPSACTGLLTAGAATLLPAFTPRNHHFTSPYELDLNFE